MAHEGIQSLEESMNMNPLILDAFIRVLNKRTEEQKAEQDKLNEDAKEKKNVPSDEKTLEKPPDLRPQDKEKLNQKLNAFQNWMNDNKFQETYEQMKYEGYVEGKWDEGK